jgi:hypothetical protein
MISSAALIVMQPVQPPLEQGMQRAVVAVQQPHDLASLLVQHLNLPQQVHMLRVDSTHK